MRASADGVLVCLHDPDLAIDLRLAERNDLHRRSTVPQRDVRHHPCSEPGCHAFDDRRDRVDLGDVLGHDVHLGELGVDQVSQRHVVAEAHVGRRREDFTRRSAGSVGRRDHHQRLTDERTPPQHLRHADVLRHDRHVQTVGHDVGDQRIGQADAQVDLQLGVGLAQGDDCKRQQADGAGSHRPDVQRPRGATAFEDELRLLDEPQNLPRHIEQLEPLQVQAWRPRLSVEDRASDLRLQVDDLLADRRRRDVNGFRGARECSLIGDGDEGPELPGIHVRSSAWARATCRSALVDAL